MLLTLALVPIVLGAKKEEKPDFKNQKCLWGHECPKKQRGVSIYQRIDSKGCPDTPHLDYCCVERDVCISLCGSDWTECQEIYAACAKPACEDEDDCRELAAGAIGSQTKDQRECAAYETAQTKNCHCIRENQYELALQKHLKDFYKKHNPEKLSEKGQLLSLDILEKYKGNETVMFMQMYMKYANQTIRFRKGEKIPPRPFYIRPPDKPKKKPKNYGTPNYDPNTASDPYDEVAAEKAQEQEDKKAEAKRLAEEKQEKYDTLEPLELAKFLLNEHREEFGKFEAEDLMNWARWATGQGRGHDGGIDYVLDETVELFRKDQEGRPPRNRDSGWAEEFKQSLIAVGYKDFLEEQISTSDLETHEDPEVRQARYKEEMERKQKEEQELNDPDFNSPDDESETGVEL
jgi:hypothetical protein